MVRGDPPRGPAQARVVDQPGQREEAGHVVDLVRSDGRRAGADGGDAPILHEDVGVRRARLGFRIDEGEAGIEVCLGARRRRREEGG